MPRSITFLGIQLDNSSQLTSIPPEILEAIFLELRAFSSLQKCTKWQGSPQTVQRIAQRNPFLKSIVVEVVHFTFTGTWRSSCTTVKVQVVILLLVALEREKLLPRARLDIIPCLSAIHGCQSGQVRLLLEGSHKTTPDPL